MTVPRCPRDSKGRLECSHHAEVENCQSLHYGLHQPCKMADGWLTCLDIEIDPKNEANCKDNFGVHKDSAWVQDGCTASFTACYINDVNDAVPRHRTVECRELNGGYKQCPVDGAHVVEDVELKYEIPSRAKCAKGINFGIFKDSIWIHGGCNGIFNITYYEEPLKTKATKSPSTAITQESSAIATKQPTTKLPVPQKSTTGAPLPVHSPTSGKTTTAQTTTYHTVDSPFRSTDSLVPIALAVAMGALVVILLIVFAALWFCRRNKAVKRYLHERTEDGDKRGREIDEMSNHYEEIAPVLNPPGYDKAQETDPFLANTDTKLNHSGSGEPNNNPPLPPPNNYFILEPHTPDPPTPPRGSLILPGISYYPLDTTPPPPPMLDNMTVQPYAHAPVGSNTELPSDHMPSAPPLFVGIDDGRGIGNLQMRYRIPPEHMHMSFQTFNPRSRSAFVPIGDYNRGQTFPMNNLNLPPPAGNDGYEKAMTRHDRDSVQSDNIRSNNSSIKSGTLSSPSEHYYPNHSHCNL